MPAESLLPELPSIQRAQLLADLAQARSPILVIKPLLADIQKKTYEYFRATLDAALLVRLRAQLIDTILSCLWEHTGLLTPECALIAVGGYGRGELHPHSDIDLLLLCTDETHINALAEPLQAFITLLWDLKLNVGHSVRTLNECIAAADNDLTIITNLIESRTLSGNADLHQALMQATAPETMWPTSTFFHAKWDEIRNRQRKHNSSEYNLEPNVKNSPGALRDIQSLVWVAIRQFGHGDLQSLHTKGFLTAAELQHLERSLYFLWQVRFALHLLSGREEDRLLFDLQRQVAELLGFQDDKKQLGVEQLMNQFYRNQLATMELCDVLLLHFNEEFLVHENNDSIEPLNEHFCLNNGYLQVIDPNLFEEQPQWLLEVFLLMARTLQAKGIHSQTIRALRKNRHLINADYRSNPQHNRLFMELLHNGTRVVRELRRMMRYGILGRYIPEFGHIIGMMEHDLFHIYTVDEHSFRMMHFIRRLRFGDIRERFPVASELALKHLAHKEVLYLVSLLHDTGKCMEGRHSDNSGDIARAFCQQHQLSNTDSAMVEWLCIHHLSMSHASQRLELNDPSDIHRFALNIPSQLHLDLLYLVSVGDIVSTNPQHWTSWRAEQINRLYNNASEALARGLDQPIRLEERVQNIRTQVAEQLILQGFKQPYIDQLIGNPGNDYFIREGAENIVWHLQAIAAHGNNSQPLVAIRPTSSHQHEGATQIFIFMKDQEHIFAAATATLDQLNLNIQDARIMTSETEHNVVDTFIVLDADNLPIEDAERLTEIQRTLETALADSENFTTLIRRRTPRALKQFKVPTQVTISNDPLRQCTQLEVIAADRPGLLARMGAIFAEHHVQLKSAKILTEGEQVLDIFHILDRHGKPFSDPLFLETLKIAIIEGLAEQVAAQSAV